MALSNWDTLSIGPDSKSSDGSFTFTNNTEVEIYKNWCYISNPDMWKEVNDFTSPVIAQFNYGEINLAGIELKAIRDDKQSSIFLFTSEGYGKEMKIFAGIGCYGFADIFELYCKERNIEYKPYDYSSSKEVDGEWRETVGWFKNNEEIVLDKGIDLNPWIGVEKETLENFKNWLDKEIIGEYNGTQREWFNKIDWDNLLRFNQGDAFFSENLNIELPSTEVEKTEEPIMIQILKDA